MTGYLVASLAIPLGAGLAVLALPARWRRCAAVPALVAAGANLVAAAGLFRSGAAMRLPWANYGIEFALRVTPLSGFILAAAAALSFLVLLFASSHLDSHPAQGRFLGLALLTLGFANGAVLADNLIVLLFFWEGMLGTLLAMIALGGRQAVRTAMKAFTIVAIGDLCMMFGVALVWQMAGTFSLSDIELPVSGATASAAFCLMMAGALAKGGAMPFHSWIPDAAVDAPLPFMALLPGSLEKLTGIYLAARISFGLFVLKPDTWVSNAMMAVGAATIVLAVLLALVQKDFKKLLSYHAISQVGYMVLGIGTAVPAGMVGGLFHMLNNALYKCGLFLAGGSVERQAGTTDLARLGGLARQMPVTAVCFFIAALSISGVPPFNGFFSKELVFDGALERGFGWYLAALGGAFFTAASFLKLGHAAFLGSPAAASRQVREAPLPMLVPMAAIAAACILFGVWNRLPLSAFIEPSFAPYLEGHRSFGGMPGNAAVAGVSVAVLLLAWWSHSVAVRRSGSALGASDIFHRAPGLAQYYRAAETPYADPYDLGVRAAGILGRAAWACDRAVDWVYERFAVICASSVSRAIRTAHTGRYASYLGWILAGAAIVALAYLRSM